MDSALNPREIQSRIRAGESLEDVAQAAGVPAEQVEPFAAPVIAERAHVAGSALASPVRRRGETRSVRAMRQVVSEQLLAAGIDSDAVDWDAWRGEDRTWTVRGRYDQGGEQQEALFHFDQKARFSTAINDTARSLIGESLPSAQRPTDPDAEPTIDLDDELALVRATQDSPVQRPRPTLVPRPSSPATPTEAPATPAAASEGSASEPPDYMPVEFEQVDGVYDIVPNQQGDLDVLYDMLSSFNEDSVNIYAGLSQPVTAETPADDEPTHVIDRDEQVQVTVTEVQSVEITIEPVQDDATSAVDGGTEGVAADEDAAAEPDTLAEGLAEAGSAQATGVSDQPVSAEPEPPAPSEPEQDALVEHEDAPAEAQPEAPVDPEPQAVPAEPEPQAVPAETESQAVPAEPKPEAAPAEAEQEAPAESEQDALVEVEQPPKPKPRSSRKRASVPSWDEIMFGSPKRP